MKNNRYLSYDRLVRNRSKEKTLTLLIAAAIIIVIAGAVYVSSAQV